MKKLSLLVLCSQSIIFLSILLIVACGNEKKNDYPEIIDVESNMNRMEIINLSQFTDNIQYIPLETNEKFPLVWLRQVEISGNLILVTDMKTCLLYNSEGKFLAKIGSEGRGPGEYRFAQNICFWPENIISLQDLEDLLFFKEDGSFIKKYKNVFRFNQKEEEYLESITLIDDSLFFGHNPNTTGLISDKATILNKNGEIKYSFKNHIKFKRERTVASGFENHAHIYPFENLIFYKEFYNDTLFALNSEYKLLPFYIFSLGKFREPVSDRMKVPRGPDMFKHLFIWSVFQTDKYLMINCQFGDNFPAKRLTSKTIMGMTMTRNTTNALGLYNKQSKELIFCEPTSTDNPLFTSGLYNDIDGGPRFFPTKQVNDSTLMMWLKPDELKAHVASDDFKNSNVKSPEKKKELETLANNLDESDNPVLMFVTFHEKSK